MASRIANCRPFGHRHLGHPACQNWRRCSRSLAWNFRLYRFPDLPNSWCCWSLLVVPIFRRSLARRLPIENQHHWSAISLPFLLELGSDRFESRTSHQFRLVKSSHHFFGLALLRWGLDYLLRRDCHFQDCFRFQIGGWNRFAVRSHYRYRRLEIVSRCRCCPSRLVVAHLRLFSDHFGYRSGNQFHCLNRVRPSYLARFVGPLFFADAVPVLVLALLDLA